MFLKKDLQPFGDDIGVGRRDCHAAGIRDLQAVNEAVTLRRCGETGRFGDSLSQFLIEFCAFIKGDR